MAQRPLAILIAKIVPAAALIACSSQSPLAPRDGTRADDVELRLARAIPGFYDLEFSWSGTELTIIAHVRDANNAAPEGGTVTLQYCSLGPPTNDITQPDEAASSACADHSGHWVTLAKGSLNSSGDFVLPFGPVSVVTVIGFRLVYTGQGSGVQNGTAVEDWYRPI
ncbi:MAG: hypothetical protein ACSLFK_14430 [Gemmatimonadaceae bacterium]